MSGTSQHALCTMGRSAPSATRAQATTHEAGQSSREDNQRRSRIASQPLALHRTIPDKTYQVPLTALDLSLRLFLVFQRAGISTVGQVLEMDLEAFERLGLGKKSIQEVVQRVQALGALELIRSLVSESLQAGPSIPVTEPALSSGSPGGRAPTHDALDDAVVLAGHRHGWAVIIDEEGRPKREQWYLDIAPGTFPYPAGTLIEHDGQYYVLKSIGASMLRVSLFQEDEDLSSGEELPEDGNPPQVLCEHPGKPRLRCACYEVSVSCLPTKYRDRISRHQRTCWVETPVPSSIRPGYFLTRIGSTPDQLRDKRPVFVTETEAAALVSVSQAPALAIKVAPAFLLPQDIQRAIFPGIARPTDLCEFAWEQPGRQNEKRAGKTLATDTPMKVPIPEHLCRLSIQQLGLPHALEGRLKLAGITRVGPLLEMGEDSFRALSIDDNGMLEITRRLQSLQALPSREALVYEECYLHITDITSIDEQQDHWRMVYVSVFPDRLSGWRSGPVYTVWLRQQHVDLAMDWDRSLLSLDTHTLRVSVNEYVREHGAVAPPLRTPKPKHADKELGLSASQNIFIPREAIDGVLGALPPGEEERRYLEQRADKLFGVPDMPAAALFSLFGYLEQRADKLFGVLQEEWLALGHQAVVREREQLLRAGQRKEMLVLEQVAACIEQVEDWYARRRVKPRILGLCGVYVEDRVMHERTYIVREKGRSARKQTIRWTEPVPRLVGYHLVVGAPPWVVWPEDWAQKPGKERDSA